MTIEKLKTRTDGNWTDKDLFEVAVEIMDKEKPGWWKHEIVNLDKLDLSSCSRCIIGQAFRVDEKEGYWSDIIDGLERRYFGTNGYTGQSVTNAFASSTRFQYMWEDLITNRRLAEDGPGDDSDAWSGGFAPNH